MALHVLTLRTPASTEVVVLPSRRAALGRLTSRLAHSQRGATALARLLTGEVDRATVGSLTVQLEAALDARCTLPLTTEELRYWHHRALAAMGTSNDAEHDILVEIVDVVAAALQAADAVSDARGPEHG